MCNLYGIFDKKGSCYVLFFNSRGDDTLLRDVVRLLESAKGSDFVRFPNDFSVYRLASIDEETGRVYPESMPQHMSELVSYFRSEEKESEVKEDEIS